MKLTVRENTKLIDLIQQMYTGISRQKAKKIIQHQTILCNGTVFKGFPTEFIEAGTVIEVVKEDTSQAVVMKPTKQHPVAIYFEDAWMLVAIKPAGILTASIQDDRTPSLHKNLEAFMSQRDDKKTRLWPVHRLDKEVEGLVMFAKSEEIKEAFIEIWRSVQKTYMALTEQRPKKDADIIENWLKEGPKQKMFSYDKEIEGSKYAKTEYQFIRTIGKYHLLEIKLHTGRKNQIRVHLSGMGCPIVGDWKYGGDKSVIRQIRLAAVSLQMEHPVTHAIHKFDYQPPDKFFSPSEKYNERYK